MSIKEGEADIATQNAGKGRQGMFRAGLLLNSKTITAVFWFWEYANEKNKAGKLLSTTTVSVHTHKRKVTQ